MINQSTQTLFSDLLHTDFAKMMQNEELNLAKLTLSKEGFKPYIKNIEEVAPVILERLRNQAFSIGTSESIDDFMQYQELVLETVLDSQKKEELVGDSLTPIISLKLQTGSVSLRLFSVLSTFGTPQDITTDELRIEFFYPMDQQTRNFFKRS